MPLGFSIVWILLKRLQRSPVVCYWILLEPSKGDIWKDDFAITVKKVLYELFDGCLCEHGICNDVDLIF